MQPCLNEGLLISKMISRQSSRRDGGIGSSKYDLVGESLIILWTSSSLTDSKAFKAGGGKVGALVKKQK